MSQQSIVLNLPAGAVLKVPGTMAIELERALHDYRRVMHPRRDLVSEIEVYLGGNPGSTTTEVARGIRARDEDVRAALRGDQRFQRVRPAPGRSRRAKPWEVAPRAPGAVPGVGTSAQTGVPDHE